MVRFECCLERTIKSSAWTPDGETMLFSVRDDLISFISWDYRLIAGAHVKEVSLQVGPSSRRTTDVLPYRSWSYDGNNDHSSVRRERTEDILYTLERGPMHAAVYGFDLRLAQNQGLEFQKTINKCNKKSG